jgi:hypothetical protein
MPNSLARTSRNRWQILSVSEVGMSRMWTWQESAWDSGSQAPDVNIVDFANALHLEQWHSQPVPDSMPLGRLSSRMFVDSVITPSAVHTIIPEIRNAIIGSISHLAGSLNQPSSGNESEVGERVAQVVNEDRSQVQVAAARSQRRVRCSRL